MKVQVTIKQQNSEFDREYAVQYKDGEGSPGNWKDNWSNSFKIDQVEKVVHEKHQDRKLELIHEDGRKINALFTNLRVCKCETGENEPTEYWVSESILDKTHQPENSKYNIVRFYFYLKDKVEYVKINERMYVALKELPTELKPESLVS